MAEIKIQKIISKDFADGIPAHEDRTYTWNNPPTGTVLSFYAIPRIRTDGFPLPDAITGHGSLRIGNVTHTFKQSHGGVKHHHVDIQIYNVGDTKVGFSLFMSWVDT